MLKSLQNPVLILVRGIPGSGKTYYAENLVGAFSQAEAILLDPDTTDYNSQEYAFHVNQQLSEGVDSKLHPYRFLRQKAFSAIAEHKIIIWNQPFSNLEILQKVTARLEEYAKEQKTTLPILIIEMSLDTETARSRVEQRKKNGGHGPSEATFIRFVSNYASAAPLGYEIIELYGHNDPQQTIPQVIDRINKLRS